MPSPDADKTITPHAPGDTGEPGDFVSSSSFFGHTLPEGTRVGEFVIKGLIGEGGFGIVYLAYDPSLQRHVALKEYMPASLAGRASGGVDVVVKSDRHVDTFKAGLKSFVNEARLLARFDHRSLVKVYRFWEDHGTAYMVMPYYEGPTLKRALAERAEPPDEAALRAWLDPLLDALAVLHEAHCFHRDIAPDNILLTATGPLLLDFGAARRVIGDMTQALTVMLKPGYAPIEQYGESSAMTQGAWTDLYALASVVHCAITGLAPMSSVERLMSDTLVPLRIRAAGRYSDTFLRAIDAALALRPNDRPQDVAAFRALLDPAPAPAPAAPAPPPALPTPTAHAEPAPMHVDIAMDEFAPPVASPWDSVAPASGRGRSRHAWKLVGAAVVLAGLAATPLLFTVQHEPDAPVASPPATAAAEPGAPVPAAAPAAPAAAQAPAEASVPATTPAPVTAPAVTPAPAPEPPPVAVAPPAPVARPAPAEVEPAASAAAAPRPRVAAAPAAAGDRAAKAAPRPAEDKAEPAAERPQKSPPRSEANASKCSDILQKASLEALSADETAFLRKECK